MPNTQHMVSDRLDMAAAGNRSLSPRGGMLGTAASGGGTSVLGISTTVFGSSSSVMLFIKNPTWVQSPIYYYWDSKMCTVNAPASHAHVLSAAKAAAGSMAAGTNTYCTYCGPAATRRMASQNAS